MLESKNPKRSSKCLLKFTFSGHVSRFTQPHARRPHPSWRQLCVRALVTSLLLIQIPCPMISSTQDKIVKWTATSASHTKGERKCVHEVVTSWFVLNVYLKAFEYLILQGSTYPKMRLTLHFLVWEGTIIKLLLGPSIEQMMRAAALWARRWNPAPLLADPEGWARPAMNPCACPSFSTLCMQVHKCCQALLTWTDTFSQLHFNFRTSTRGVVLGSQRYHRNARCHRSEGTGRCVHVVCVGGLWGDIWWPKSPMPSSGIKGDTQYPWIC